MKKTKGTRKSGYLQREQFYYPAHNFIDVSVPSFDYAIPRFFFGYLAAAIFCKNNRDYLLSVPLKVGAPLCLIPKRVHVSNCSNRAKKMQAGCQKYLVPWPILSLDVKMWWNSDIKLFYFMLKCKIACLNFWISPYFFLTTSRLYKFKKYKINDSKNVQ